MSGSESMIERVARAIYDGRNGRGAIPWSRREWSHREPYLKDARAVIDAIGPELRAAITYFDGYCQDEADYEEYCLAGTNQYRDAVAFANAVKALRSSLTGDSK